MKILYITSRAVEINTSSSIRNLATISGLVELGHDVSVVSINPDKNHPAFDESMHIPVKAKQLYFELNGMQSMKKISRKLKILNKIRVLAYKIYNKHELYDNLKGIIKYVNCVDVSNYDLVLSSSDPKSSHLFAEKLLENCSKKVKWIQIWGDPFASDITQRNKKLFSKIKNEEARLLSKADRIIYVSELTLLSQKNIYEEQASKMFYVPTPILKLSTSKKVKNNSLELLYAGDYGSHIRNIKPLYEAVQEFPSNTHLTICGNSDFSLKNSDNITILPRQGLGKVKELEEKADILVQLSNLRGSQIPGKIYQYSGTNKPILYILDGDEELIVNMFGKYNRYDFCQNDKDSIIKVIKKIVSSDMIREPVADFDKTKIAQRIIEI